MQDKNKTQPTAFRLKESTLEKFRGIAQDMGANQEQALAKLIEVYEMEMGKETLPEMKDSIETFEGYVHAAVSMYLQALEANQNMRALVRTEFEAQLRSKDKIIEELQERADQAETVAKTASKNEQEIQEEFLKKEEAFEKQRTDLEQEIERLKKQTEEEQEAFKEKIKESNEKYENLYNTHQKLQTSEEELRTLLGTFMKENEKRKQEQQQLMEELQNKTEQNATLLHQITQLTAEKDQEKQRAKDELHRQETEFEYFKKTSDIEHQLKLQVRENELKEQHQSELNALRKELDQYKDLYYQRKKKEQ